MDGSLAEEKVPVDSGSKRQNSESEHFAFGGDARQDRNLAMQIRSLVEVESPSPLRYLIGAAVMMIGVVLPVGYMMFRNKRVPSSSSYSKQT
ncbi:unnamed protein product [Sphenostylis stenocarpa]|uniref:Transmembrane protein n=1 Tax=Sphenostylis stenocarpa TaxID=92480 RepID=A0AA86V9F2_9FABA|nr:unnamed protein product [Sphenostylis stenocarpa]